MGRRNIAWRVNNIHKSKTQMQTLPINFLHGGKLFAETETFMIAVQDRMILNKRNYRKYIL